MTGPCPRVDPLAPEPAPQTRPCVPSSTRAPSPLARGRRRGLYPDPLSDPAWPSRRSVPGPASGARPFSESRGTRGTVSPRKHCHRPPGGSRLMARDSLGSPHAVDVGDGVPECRELGSVDSGPAFRACVCLCDCHLCWLATTGLDFPTRAVDGGSGFQRSSSRTAFSVRERWGPPCPGPGLPYLGRLSPVDGVRRGLLSDAVP